MIAKTKTQLAAGLFTLIVLVGGFWLLPDASGPIAPVEAPTPTAPEERQEVILGAEGTRVISELYTSDTTWDAPTGVTSVIVEAIGGGAGGTTNTGGGGGGGYASAISPVTAGNTYTIDVGAGGAAAASGSDSIFSYSGTVKLRADAGLTAAGGGTGGATAISSGSTEYAGGNATPATGTRGGGGGAGNLGAGTNATNAGVSGGASVFGGGSNTGTTTNGYDFGSGGGSTATGQSAGHDGMVRLTYTISDATAFPKIVYRLPSPNTTSNGTTYTMTAPASSFTDPGDVYVILFAHSSNTDSNITTGSGWTELASSSNSTTISAFAYTKVATASAEPNVVITSATTQQSAGTWYVIRDATIDGAAATNGSSTNANPPSDTFAGGSANYVVIAAAGFDGNANGTRVSAKPSGYESFYHNGFRAATGVAVGLASADKRVTGTSEDPGTFTNTSEQWAALTVSLKYQDGSPAAAPVDPIIWFD